MSSHTPGPWSIDEDGDVIAREKLICVVTGADKNNDEERPANAKLIAAAPELLKVLSDIFDRNFAFVGGEAKGISDEDVCRARTVIAKATT